MSKVHHLIVAGCLFTAFAVAAGPSSAQVATKNPAEENVGGYGTASVDDKGVIEAANFAVKTKAAKEKEKLALVKVLKAESQIVAGRNYKLTLDVRVKGGVRTAQAIVYSKLDGSNELSKWDWAGETRREKKKNQ